MSYDKNTIDMSAIDDIVEVLKETGTKYRLEVIGHVRGHGLNDDFSIDKDGFISNYGYDMRRLEYGNVVILEQMIRSIDCDCDDYIHSFKFMKETEPKNWKIEVCLDDEGNIKEEE